MSDDAIDHVKDYQDSIRQEYEQDLLDFGQPGYEQHTSQLEDEVNEARHEEEDEYLEYLDAAETKQRSQAIKEAHEMWQFRKGRYYFQSRPGSVDEVAFKDDGKKLKTHLNNKMVARSMVKLEASKGPGDVHVKGAREFRRLAWQAGAQMGIKVTGYEPSEEEVLSVSTYQTHKKLAEKVVKEKILDPESQERTLTSIEERQRELELEELQMYDHTAPSNQPTQEAPERARSLHR